MSAFLPDVNILIYAHREEMPQHEVSWHWLEQRVESDDTIYLLKPVLAGFIRIVTNPRAFPMPSPVAEAFLFVAQFADAPTFQICDLPASHWPAFESLCVKTEAVGNLVSDAYLAAAVIQLNAELISTDRDFSRFPGLRFSSLP